MGLLVGNLNSGPKRKILVLSPIKDNFIEAAVVVILEISLFFCVMWCQSNVSLYYNEPSGGVFPEINFKSFRKLLKTRLSIYIY